MSEKSLKIEVETPGWELIDPTGLLKEMKEKVLAHLNEKNLYVSDSIINNSCKNALSLARSKKKAKSKFLPVYIPRSLFDSSPSSSPISVSSTDANDNSSDEQEYLLTNNDVVQQVPLLTFDYTNEEGLMICTNFIFRDKDTICIQPGNTCLHIHICESFALRALELFDLNGSIDINEILIIIRTYCKKRQIVPDITKTEETIKTTILDRRINNVESNIFTCTIILYDSEYCLSNEENVDLDVLLGPVYSTRGTKRKSQIVPFDSENSDLEESSDDDDCLCQSGVASASKRNYKQNPLSIKKEELKRKFLHIKDEHHITDSAIKAMYQFFKESKEVFYSMAELEQVRNKSNQKIPLKFTKDSAYAPFEFALRVAVFVAIKFLPDLLQLNKLSFRLNMDGTLMGNKHVVAISVNCVDGGASCHTAKKLVPVGIFEIQKESNELLRKTLPKYFLDSIQSVKYLNVTRKKTVAVKIRLGGDFQNAVYVFGLAGVHCNYPCVFCTQSKSYLHVTDKNTECEEKVWVGTGKNKNKQKQKIIVNPTSSYDPTRGARTLEEKRTCLAKKEKAGANNELGYQSEPLFGDLFEFSDYVMDTLHMRLRIFDILLKDILAEGSRTGEYEPAHSKKLEEKLDILNKHSIAM
ncbi:unnamed protein product [Rotaria socialis]|uniref:Uncharacterized protein n=1 Tax=Rotaria socialis TaxID=392032 RepID=A0A817WQZ0_9BILA|nr:unnamed protein product [Rotaria socialis]